MAKNILIIDPYFSGSHRQWATGLKRYSRHRISIFSLPGRHWKWRMHGGAITLAERFRNLDRLPDLILATDMLDVVAFRAFSGKNMMNIPVVTYFHENQFSYPKSGSDTDRLYARENHYGFINYTSALASNRVIFNSRYNQTTFIDSVNEMLSRLPDYQDKHRVEEIKRKSVVLYPGIDTETLDRAHFTSTTLKPPLIIWNHRWEYDKNPVSFFNSLLILKNRGISFRLAVMGQHHSQFPDIFHQMKDALSDRIIHFGYLQNQTDYAGWLHSGNVLPVTSNQDFFGISIIEAVYCGCLPLLPFRLAYPEIIPDEYYEKLFYQNDEMFLKKLELFLKNPPWISESELSEIGNQYSWRKLINDYDNLFSSVTEERS